MGECELVCCRMAKNCMWEGVVMCCRMARMMWEGVQCVVGWPRVDGECVVCCRIVCCRMAKC